MQPDTHLLRQVTNKSGVVLFPVKFFLNFLNTDDTHGLRMSHVVADQAFCPVCKDLLQTEVKMYCTILI